MRARGVAMPKASLARDDHLPHLLTRMSQSDIEVIRGATERTRDAQTARFKHVRHESFGSAASDDPAEQVSPSRVEGGTLVKSLWRQMMGRRLTSYLSDAGRLTSAGVVDLERQRCHLMFRKNEVLLDHDRAYSRKRGERRWLPADSGMTYHVYALGSPLWLFQLLDGVVFAEAVPKEAPEGLRRWHIEVDLPLAASRSPVAMPLEQAGDIRSLTRVPADVWLDDVDHVAQIELAGAGLDREFHVTYFDHGVPPPLGSA
jgi:hypothetical protein